MFEKIKRKVAIVMFAMCVMSMSAMSAFAESTGSANTDVVSAMTTVANDMKATATSLLPIALTVIGLMLVVKFGLKFFKSITGR